MVGFKEIKNLYLEDPYFSEAWNISIVPVTLDRMEWLDFIIQDGMLFKGI